MDFLASLDDESDIAWSDAHCPHLDRSFEAYVYETRTGAPISVPLLAFVGGGIYLIRTPEWMHEILDATPRFYSWLGLERNGEKRFAAELYPCTSRGRDPNCPPWEPPHIGTWVDWDDAWKTSADLDGEEGETVPDGTRVWIVDHAGGEGQGWAPSCHLVRRRRGIHQPGEL